MSYTVSKQRLGVPVHPLFKSAQCPKLNASPIAQLECLSYDICDMCHAAALWQWGCFWQHVLLGFIPPHRQVEVYYARVVILTTDFWYLMLWVQAWACVCVCVCVCSSFTWRRGSVSHWCARSLILSSCCCSSSAPSGRGSWTQSDCTLCWKKQKKLCQHYPKNKLLSIYYPLRLQSRYTQG